MTASIRKDGTISFGSSSGLLSVESITRIALGVLKETQEANDRWDAQERIRQLRSSCGVPNEPMTIRIGLPKDFTCQS